MSLLRSLSSLHQSLSTANKYTKFIRLQSFEWSFFIKHSAPVIFAIAVDYFGVHFAALPFVHIDFRSDQTRSLSTQSSWADLISSALRIRTASLSPSPSPSPSPFTFTKQIGAINLSSATCGSHLRRLTTTTAATNRCQHTFARVNRVLTQCCDTLASSMRMIDHCSDLVACLRI